MNKTDKKIENRIEEITQRLLKPSGYAVYKNQQHTEYICIGNLVEELTNLLNTEVQKAREEELLNSEREE